MKLRLGALEGGVEISGSDAAFGVEVPTVGCEVDQDPAGQDAGSEGVCRAVHDPGRRHGLPDRDPGVQVVVDGHVGNGVEMGDRGVVGVDHDGVGDRGRCHRVEVHHLQHPGRHRRRVPDRAETCGQTHGIYRAGQTDVLTDDHVGGRARSGCSVDEVEVPS